MIKRKAFGVDEVDLVGSLQEDQTRYLTKDNSYSEKHRSLADSFDDFESEVKSFESDVANYFPAGCFTPDTEKENQISFRSSTHGKLNILFIYKPHDSYKLHNNLIINQLQFASTSESVVAEFFDFLIAILDRYDIHFVTLESCRERELVSFVNKLRFCTSESVENTFYIDIHSLTQNLRAYFILN